MTNPIVHIEFQVKDSRKAAEWYREVFGWDTQYDETLKYGMFTGNEGSVGGGFADQGGSGTVAYIGTDDIPGMLAKVVAHGGKIVQPEMPIPGMGAFGICADPDGNLIGFYKGN